MIYALTFFGIILGSSLIWRLIAGDFPKGIPLVVIWIIALIALIAVGYRRLYLNSPEEPEADEDRPEPDDNAVAKKPAKKKPPAGKQGGKSTR